MTNPALQALRYHVTGAIERGEAEPIAEVRPAYADLDTHWFECRSCRGVSLDSDTYALMRGGVVPRSSVTHDAFCPGAVFPDKYVRRITQL